MNDELRATSDSIRYKKCCPDFICLSDGTIYRECKYCDLSLKCRQVGYVNSKPMPMEQHYCPIVDPRTGETISWDYYCTGMYDKRAREERIEGDDKIS